MLLIRHLCHFLQLAVSHASLEYLSRNLEFLISETFKWFSISSMRQLSNKNLYEAINDGKSPLKIPANCKTRWLSIEPAVGQIITQWLELKTHFDVTRMSKRCYTAEILTEIYKDEKSLAVLLFLHPILVDVQQVNKLFETKVVDKMMLLDNLTHLLKSIANKLINPSSRFDYLNFNIKEFLNLQPYFGI